MRSQGSILIKDAKDRYFKKIGAKLSRPDNGIKTYWSLINNILNKAKIPIIPPLLENDAFLYSSNYSSSRKSKVIMCEYSNVKLVFRPEEHLKGQWVVMKFVLPGIILVVLQSRLLV